MWESTFWNQKNQLLFPLCVLPVRFPVVIGNILWGRSSVPILYLCVCLSVHSCPRVQGSCLNAFWTGRFTLIWHLHWVISAGFWVSCYPLFFPPHFAGIHQITSQEWRRCRKWTFEFLNCWKFLSTNMIGKDFPLICVPSGIIATIITSQISENFNQIF